MLKSNLLDPWGLSNSGTEGAGKSGKVVQMAWKRLEVSTYCM